jgi:hypothetical protein
MMFLERRKNYRGIAWVDCDGVLAVMDQPQIIVVKRRNR